MASSTSTISVAGTTSYGWREARVGFSHERAARQSVIGDPKCLGPCVITANAGRIAPAVEMTFHVKHKLATPNPDFSWEP